MSSNSSKYKETRDLLSRGEFRAAEAAARDLLRHMPPDPSALVLLGAALVKQERFEDGLEPLGQALEYDRGLVEGWNWLSISLRNLGRLKEAESACLTGLQHKPDDPGLNFNLGLVYMAAHEFERASQYLERALYVYPQNPQIQQNLGLAYQEMGEDGNAEACFTKAIQLAPTAEQPLLSLASLALERGDFQRASTCAMQALALAPNSVSSHLLAARSNMAASLVREAQAHIDRILELDPENSLAYALQGTQRQYEGDFEAAAAAFGRSIELNPRQGIAYWGLLQGKRGSTEDIEWLPQMLHLAEDERIEPSERIYLYYAAGKISETAGDFVGAVKSFDNANAMAAATTSVVGRFSAEAYRSGFARIKEVFSSGFIESCGGLDNASSRPIFIVGMIRSGTTLMEQILSSHPDVQGGGELRFWGNRGRDCLNLAAGSIDPAKAKAAVEAYLELLKSLSSEAPHVTDKTPENLQMLGLLSILFPHAKFINLTRNPVENCLSIYTTPYAFPPEFAYSRMHIAIAYEEHRLLAEHWQTVLPKGALIDVSYEQLTTAPEPMIRAALDHCGLPWSEQCLRPEENKRKVLTPSLWHARQPIFQSSRERGKNYKGALPEFEQLQEGSPDRPT